MLCLGCVPVELRSTIHNHCHAAGAEELISLRGKLAFATKERAALKTILEGKMLPLTEELSRTLSADFGSRAPSSSEEVAAGAERLGRQLSALQRLLSATVAAMARGAPQ